MRATAIAYHSSNSLWRDWIAANAAGELLGLGSVAGLGFVMVPIVENLPVATASAVTGVTMVLLGLLEGYVVGLAQWLVLRRLFPGISRESWIRATLAGAATAWTLGMIPSLLLQGGTGSTPTEEPGIGLLLVLAAAMGAVLGPVLALFQWRVLRQHVENAGWWIPANSMAWMAGMPVIFLGIEIASNMDSVAAAVVVIASALSIAGAVVGALHGWRLLRFTAATMSRNNHPGR